MMILNDEWEGLKEKVAVASFQVQFWNLSGGTDKWQ
jgi:hypothetical protein